MREAGRDGRTQASIARVVEGADARMFRRKPVNERAASVPAAVVDQDHLEVVHEPGGDTLGLRREPRQILDLVVYRVDERKGHGI